MMRSRLLAAFLLLCCADVRALSLDGDAQLHATVGQPLNTAVPLTLAPGEASKLVIEVSPVATQPKIEREAAGSVTAEYVDTASGPAVHLVSPSRITVPTISLHLEVSAGGVTVARDLSVLFDVPDLYAQSSFAGGNRGSVTAGTDASMRALNIRRDERSAVTAGDAAANGPVAPADEEGGRSSRYQVRSGDTLPKIAARLADAYPAGADALSLAIYEANPQAFKPGDPEHPIFSRELVIPNTLRVNDEPADRVSAFKQYLRHPGDGWTLPARPAPAAAPAIILPPDEQPLFRHLPLLVAAGVLLIVVPLLLLVIQRMLRPLRRLRRMRRYHTMPPPSWSTALPARVPPAPPAQPEPSREVTVPFEPRPAAGPRPVFYDLEAGPEPVPMAEPLRESLPLRASLPLRDSLPEPGPGFAADEASEPVELARLRYMLQVRPERADIRLRLVHRLYDLRRGEHFAEIALPLRSVLPATAWQNVRAMAHELLPDDPRFTAQEAAAS
jgi:hypothetical protein